jgi:hypothetical protein
MQHPRSLSELKALARRQARLSRGRAAFVREARVLPIGLPVAIGLAAVVLARMSRPRRDWRHPLRPRRRASPEALGVAAAALGGALALAYVEARIEWALVTRPRDD